MHRAVYFASRRAARVGAVVIMLRVIEPGVRNQVWLKVAEIMRAEELGQAHAMLEKYAARAKEVAGIAAEGLIREGDKAAEILRLIEADEDIAAIVLAAGTEKEGPGLLVTELARTAGKYPIPIAIVPGGGLSTDGSRWVAAKPRFFLPRPFFRSCSAP